GFRGGWGGRGGGVGWAGGGLGGCGVPGVVVGSVDAQRQRRDADPRAVFVQDRPAAGAARVLGGDVHPPLDLAVVVLVRAVPRDLTLRVHEEQVARIAGEADPRADLPGRRLDRQQLPPLPAASHPPPIRVFVA